MILSFHGRNPLGYSDWSVKLTIHHHLEPRLTMRVITLTYPHTSSRRGVCYELGEKTEKRRNLRHAAQLFFGSNNRAFCRTRMFITVLTTSRHRSLLRSSTFTCCFLKIHFTPNISSHLLTNFQLPNRSFPFKFSD